VTAVVLRGGVVVGAELSVGLTSVCSGRHGAVTPSAKKGTRRAGAGRR